MNPTSPEPAPTPSRGQRARLVPLDPRLRVAVAGILVVAVLGPLRSTAAMAVVLAYTTVVYALTGGRLGDLAAHARRLAPFVVLIAVVNALAAPGHPLVIVAGHGVASREGLAAGVFFSIRLAVLYLGMAILVATTPPEDAAAAAHALLRPFSRRLASRVAFHAFIAMGFLPLFSDEIDRIRTAQSFRGGALTGGFVDRVRAVRLLVVPLVVSAIHRSGQLAMVVTLRNLEARVERMLPARRPDARDAVLPLVTLGVVIAAAAWLR